MKSDDGEENRILLNNHSTLEDGVLAALNQLQKQKVKFDCNSFIHGSAGGFAAALSKYVLKPFICINQGII